MLCHKIYFISDLYNNRNRIKNAKNQERITLQTQYRTLRNKVTSQIRKENIEFNNKKIEEANNEKELWNIANDVLNPRKEIN